MIFARSVSDCSGCSLASCKAVYRPPKPPPTMQTRVPVPVTDADLCGVLESLCSLPGLTPDSMSALGQQAPLGCVAPSSASRGEQRSSLSRPFRKGRSEQAHPPSRSRKHSADSMDGGHVKQRYLEVRSAGRRPRGPLRRQGSASCTERRAGSGAQQTSGTPTPACVRPHGG